MSFRTGKFRVPITEERIKELIIEGRDNMDKLEDAQDVFNLAKEEFKNEKEAYTAIIDHNFDAVQKGGEMKEDVEYVRRINYPIDKVEYLLVKDGEVTDIVLESSYFKEDFEMEIDDIVVGEKEDRPAKKTAKKSTTKKK